MPTLLRDVGGGRSGLLTDSAPALAFPNVVVIYLDDGDALQVERFNGLSKLAAYMLDQGTLYLSSVVARSLCGPSRGAFWTGQYHTNNHVSGNNSGSLDTTTTVFRALWGAASARKVQTGFLGKPINGYSHAASDSVGSVTRTVGVATLTVTTANTFSSLHLHAPVSGTGIPVGAYVGIVNSDKSIGLSSSPSANVPVGATSSGTSSVVFNLVNQPGNLLPAADVVMLDGMDEACPFNINEQNKIGWQANELVWDADGNLVSSAYAPDGAVSSNGVPTADTWHADDYLRSRAVRTIQRFATRPNGDARQGLPYFLYIAPTDPHDPNTPAPPTLTPDTLNRAARKAYYDTWIPNQYDTANKAKATTPHADGWFPNIDQNDPQKTGSGQPGIAALRDRMRSYIAIEDMVADIVDTCSAFPVGSQYHIDNTYIVVTSDNSFTTGMNGDWEGKLSVPDAVLRVPVIIRGPGVPANTTNNAPIANIDFAPWLCDLFGVAPLVTMDGKNLGLTFNAPTAFDGRCLFVSGLTTGTQIGVRTWDADNATTGPTGKRWKYWTQGGTRSEIETVAVTGAGSYKLGYRRYTTDALVKTAAINSTDTSAQVQTKLEAVVGAGNVVVAGSGTSYSVTFAGALANIMVQELVSSDFTGTVSKVLVLRDTPAAAAVNLFDLAADEFEMDNRGADPAYSAVVTTLEARKNTVKNCVGNACQVVF